jgi:hypothetical protein
LAINDLFFSYWKTKSKQLANKGIFLQIENHKIQKMQQLNDFEDIRSYNDQDVQPALARLLKEPMFLKASKYLHPTWSEDYLKTQFSKITTIKDFQKSVIHASVSSVIEKSTNGLEHSGIDNIPKEKACLFISNHRDIILDSAFLNIILFDYGYETTQIAIGDNLFIYPWITDFVKLNRSFVVQRGLPRNEKVLASRKLSAYIRHSVVRENISVWIAQREGRSKDGNDRTHPGLLKMLGISGAEGFYEKYNELNIVPLSVSYEFDPCDGLKTMELIGRANQTYKKTQEDDLKSMYTGIVGMKGRVHISFNEILDEEIKTIADTAPPSVQLDVLADLVDEYIISSYKLWPNNFIAYDLLNGTERFSDKYKDEEMIFFKDYMNEKLKAVQQYGTDAVRIFLEMYANPVKNQLALGKEL